MSAVDEPLAFDGGEGMGRDAILNELREAAAEAREIAQRQREWRQRVGELVLRGAALGLPAFHMARVLGLSRRWVEHLLWQAKSPAIGRARHRYRE